MSIFDWGEKRTVRNAAKAMVLSYKLFKINDPNLSETELIKLTLSMRPGESAKKLSQDLDDNDFWMNVAGQSFAEVIYILVCMENIEFLKDSKRSEKFLRNPDFKRIIKEEVKAEGL